MNVFIVEMKAHRKSLIIWAFGIIFMVAAGMGKYVALSSSGQSMNDIICSNAKIYASNFWYRYF